MDLLSQALLNDSYGINTDKNITFVRLMTSNEQIEPFMKKYGWYNGDITSQKNTKSTTSSIYYYETAYGSSVGHNSGPYKTQTRTSYPRVLIPVFDLF